ncbi:MAG: hypothetical protein GY773_31805 [Actinomycetia bacterium]|nr:hypothetical protein [Actinomycetes bacterium]MCP5035243.1 hypothetical protein [Actinomycetes bacterium]
MLPSSNARRGCGGDTELPFLVEPTVAFSTDDADPEWDEWLDYIYRWRRIVAGLCMTLPWLRSAWPTWRGPIKGQKMRLPAASISQIRHRPR